MSPTVISVTQEIDDSQSKRFTEGLQLIRTGLRLKRIVFHGFHRKQVDARYVITGLIISCDWTIDND